MNIFINTPVKYTPLPNLTFLNYVLPFSDCASNIKKIQANLLTPISAISYLIPIVFK